MPNQLFSHFTGTLPMKHIMIIESYKCITKGEIKNIYLSTDYFGTRQIIFGNNMNTIEISHSELKCNVLN